MLRGDNVVGSMPHSCSDESTRRRSDVRCVWAHTTAASVVWGVVSIVAALPCAEASSGAPDEVALTSSSETPAGFDTEAEGRTLMGIISRSLVGNKTRATLGQGLVRFPNSLGCVHKRVREPD